MAATTYDPALTRLLQHEGGYVNHPDDPGGPTNFGITIADYRRYGKPGATAADVRAMHVSEAKAIYRAKYWDAQKLDLFEPGVDYALFDYGVNSGVGRSGKVLRRLVSLPDTTSEITQEVVDAANSLHAATLAARICDERLRFLKSLQTWPMFGAGWGRRVAEVRTFALAIASDLPFVASAPLQPAQGKGVDPDEHARIRALQGQLAAAGFDPGAIDGDLGSRTVKAFQRSRGLKVDGVEGDATEPLLDRALAQVIPAPAAA